MNTQPPLNWLRSFVVAARLLSFTRAAQELGLTQAAISKHIKGLEARLGLLLFIREAHGLRLTEQGKRYHLSCAPPLEQLDRLTRQFSAKSPHERLQIHCNISYSALLLPEKMAALHARHPNLEVDINNGIWGAEHPSENTHLDIGYGPHASLQESSSLKLLARDRLFPVVSPNVAAQWATLPLIEVVGYSGEWQWWLAQQAINAQPSAMDQWITNHRQHPGVSLRTDNSMTAYQLCCQGLGVAMARTSMVQALLKTGQLQQLNSAPCLPSPDVFFAQLTIRGQEHHAAKTLFELL